MPAPVYVIVGPYPRKPADAQRCDCATAPELVSKLTPVFTVFLSARENGKVVVRQR
jgi:hypothetical protein